MPKNSSLQILRRWLEMDRELRPRYGLGLNVKTFATRSKVSPKTVRRDLAAFRELGQRMQREPVTRSRWPSVWWYEDEVVPLFTANLPPTQPRQRRKGRKGG